MVGAAPSERSRFSGGAKDLTAALLEGIAILAPALYFLTGVHVPTAVKTVSIETLVKGLRQLPDSTFGLTEPVRVFLRDNPVDADSLAPYLTWDRQHYTRNLIDRTP